MMRGCFTLILGFVCGVALMLFFWPRPPAGTPASPTAEVRVYISNAYLARTLQVRLSTLSIPTVTNVRINSNAPTSLVVHMDLSVGPLTAPASIEVAPTAEAGSVQLSVVTSEVAGIPVPSQVTDILSATINDRIAGVTARVGKVTGITVLPSGIQVSATGA